MCVCVWKGDLMRGAPPRVRRVDPLVQRRHLCVFVFVCVRGAANRSALLVQQRHLAVCVCVCARACARARDLKSVHVRVSVHACVRVRTVCGCACARARARVRVRVRAVTRFVFFRCRCDPPHAPPFPPSPPTHPPTHLASSSTSHLRRYKSQRTKTPELRAAVGCPQDPPPPGSRPRSTQTPPWHRSIWVKYWSNRTEC